MSYSIYVGEAKPSYPNEDNDFSFGWYVERISHPDAPYWECVPDKWGIVDISGKTNGRHPGYAAMSEFCKAAGIIDLFFENDDSLIAEHPGIAHLTESHARQITYARQLWEENNPKLDPGWNDGQDAVLARLIWYEWWIIWAIENCKHPAIVNF